MDPPRSVDLICLSRELAEYCTLHLPKVGNGFAVNVAAIPVDGNKEFELRKNGSSDKLPGGKSRQPVQKQTASLATMLLVLGGFGMT